MLARFIDNYFLFLFSIIPISFIIGSSISLLNIIIIDLSFVLLIIFKKDYSFFKNKSVQLLLLLYVYLLFNSLISIDKSIGFNRNVGFLRIIILFISINYFFNRNKFFEKVFYIWSSVILIVTLDVFIESFTGRNILGYGEEYGKRIVSFFKDEPIVGGYINAFYLILVGFLHDKFGKKNKNKIFFLALIIFLAIFLTGERANSIRALVAIFLFYIFFREYQFKKKLIVIFSAIVCIIFAILNSEYLSKRYIGQIIDYDGKNKKFAYEIYFNLYGSGYEIFKNYPFFGVGNKNYRVLTCPWKTQPNLDSSELNKHNSRYVCNSHPHQVYFEFISEHGIFGSIFLLFIMFKLIFSNFIFRLKHFNYTQLGSGIYLILIFLPLIPSGAFFSDYLITIFVINLGIFYASNSKFNIFSKKI